MKATDFNIAEYLQFNPAEGTMMLKSQRMVMMSAHSFGILLKEIYTIGGENMLRVFFRRFGEAAGRDDAKLLKVEFSPDTDMDWIALCPTIHTWEGIVKAVPEVINFNREDGHFYMKGTWENSFYAEQWKAMMGPSKKPICDILTGYATGYASEFFGRDLICKEPTCVACGDDKCRFEIKPREEWGDK
jgi:predicted hydrocarbon binding protein